MALSDYITFRGEEQFRALLSAESPENVAAVVRNVERFKPVGWGATYPFASWREWLAWQRGLSLYQETLERNGGDPIRAVNELTTRVEARTKQTVTRIWEQERFDETVKRSLALAVGLGFAGFLAGAAIGTAIGSSAGPYGAIIGAAVGVIVGTVLGVFPFGRYEARGRYQRMLMQLRPSERYMMFRAYRRLANHARHLGGLPETPVWQIRGNEDVVLVEGAHQLIEWLYDDTITLGPWLPELNPNTAETEPAFWYSMGVVCAIGRSDTPLGRLAAVTRMVGGRTGIADNFAGRRDHAWWLPAMDKVWGNRWTQDSSVTCGLVREKVISKGIADISEAPVSPVVADWIRREAA